MNRRDFPTVNRESLNREPCALRAGFTLVDLYEDTDPEAPIGAYFPCYIATRSVKAP